MSMRRSQCDGDPTDPVWKRTCAASSAAAASAGFCSATAFLACPNQDERQHCKARRGPTPTQIWGGSEKFGNLPLAIMGALNAHQILVRAMGPECRCAVRNAAATRVGSVRVAGGV